MNEDGKSFAMNFNFDDNFFPPSLSFFFRFPSQYLACVYNFMFPCDVSKREREERERHNIQSFRMLSLFYILDALWSVKQEKTYKWSKLYLDTFFLLTKKNSRAKFSFFYFIFRVSLFLVFFSFFCSISQLFLSLSFMDLFYFKKENIDDSCVNC